MKRQLWWVGLVIALVAAAAVAGSKWSAGRNLGAEAPGAAPGVVNVTPQQLQARLGQKDILLVNVHVPYAGQIPGTSLQIPYNEIEQHLDRLPTDRSAPIAVYCMSGRMSEVAAKELVQRGYRQVLQLEGGMLAWNQAGLPLEDWGK